MVMVWATIAALLPFSPGETLQFAVRYGPVPAGKMTLEVLPFEVWDHDTVWHFRTRAWTEGPIHWVFSVADQIDSWVSSKTFSTLRYAKQIREGRYRAQSEVQYDPVQAVAVYPDTTLPIPSGALDPLALYYYLRLQNLQVGETLRVPFHVDRKSRSLRVVVTKEEEVRTPLGSFPCWLVEPNLKEAGLLKGRGNLRVWISQDTHRWPVKIQTSLSFGSLTAILEDVRGAP